MVESENGCQWRLQGGPRKGESCGVGDQMLCDNHQKKVSKAFSTHYLYGRYANTFSNAIRWLSIDPSEAINRDVSRGPWSAREMRPPTDAEKMTRIEHAIEQGQKIIHSCQVNNAIVSLLPSLLQFPNAPPFNVHIIGRSDSRTSYYQQRHLEGAKEASDYYEWVNNRYLRILTRFGVFRGGLGETREWVCENYDDVRICATNIITNPWRERQERKNLTWAMLKEEFSNMIPDNDIFTTNWELVEADINERLRAWERFKVNPNLEEGNVYSRDRYTQDS